MHEASRRGRVLGAASLIGLLVVLAATLAASPARTQDVVPECSGRIPAAARLPDLMNMVPIHVHVQEQQPTSRLMFTVGLANVGDGPMELVPQTDLTDETVLVTANQNLYDGPTNESGNVVCKRSLADAFVFHPAHNHWHLVGVNGFEVRKALDDGRGGNWDRKQTIGASVKESFCLLDYVKLDDDQLATFGITLPSREYYDCFGIHGISSGWIDYYHHSTHGQYVDITGAAAGRYYLVLTANPDGIFVEENNANNRAWVSFNLTYNKTNNATATPLYNSVDQVGEGIRPPSGTNR
jgi:Lysyl oxidase